MNTNLSWRIWLTYLYDSSSQPGFLQTGRKPWSQPSKDPTSDLTCLTVCADSQQFVTHFKFWKDFIQQFHRISFKWIGSFPIIDVHDWTCSERIVQSLQNFKSSRADRRHVCQEMLSFTYRSSLLEHLYLRQNSSAGEFRVTRDSQYVPSEPSVRPSGYPGSLSTKISSCPAWKLVSVG